MKKVLLILALLFVAGGCFAGQADDELMKVRKIISPKLATVEYKEFANVKYLMNPKTKIEYLGNKQFAEGKYVYFFTGKYPDKDTRSTLVFNIAFLKASDDNVILSFALVSDGKATETNSIMIAKNEMRLKYNATNKEVDLDLNK